MRSQGACKGYWLLRPRHHVRSNITWMNTFGVKNVTQQATNKGILGVGFSFCLFVVKAVHNCHFVQLEVFVLKNFLFSQQKSRLFFDDHQPCLFLPIKHFRFFISLLFINENFHWQLLGDFWPKLCLSRWHILYWIAWITPAWPNILDNSKKELQPWCCKGILLTKKGKMERHEINHCLFYQCEMGFETQYEMAQKCKISQKKVEILVKFYNQEKQL